MSNQASVDCISLYVYATRSQAGSTQCLQPLQIQAEKGHKILFPLQLKPIFSKHIIKGSWTFSSALPHNQEFWHVGDTNLNAKKEEPCFQNTASSSATISSRKVGLPLLNLSLRPGKLESPSPTQWEPNSQPALYTAHSKHQHCLGRTSGRYQNPQLGLPTGFLSENYWPAEKAGKHTLP